MDFIEFINYGFIQRAIVAGSFIAILCASLGVFLVLRRLSLIGDGLAHVTFGGVAVGLLLKVYPLYVSMPIVMLAALGILRLIEKARIYGDTAIGMVSSIGIATGVIIAGIAGGFNVDLFSYLFGNILAISREELIISVALSIVVISLILFFYNELLSITFDEELAKTSGIKTRRINTILLLLIALSVVLAMKVVGILLISALLILPAVSALQIGRGFYATIILASVIGVSSVLAGIFISFTADLPTGATIVGVNFLVFAFAFLLRRLLITRALGS